MLVSVSASDNWLDIEPQTFPEAVRLGQIIEQLTKGNYWYWTIQTKAERTILRVRMSPMPEDGKHD